MVGDSQLQIEMFLYACGLGFWIGLYYEFFRTVRVLFPPTVRACFLQDILFCLSSTLATFFGFLAIADGKMYPYLFIGEIAGFLVFYHTCGQVIHVVLSSGARRCIAPLSAITRRLCSVGTMGFIRLRRRFLASMKRMLRKTGEIAKKIKLFSKKT